VKYAKGVLANPFIWFVVMFIALSPLGLASLYSVIPGPYVVNGAGLSDVMALVASGNLSMAEAVVTAADNRIAAFEVSYVASLAGTLLLSIYLFFAHRSDNIHWRAARIGVPLLVFLGAWDVINRAACKAAANEIISTSIDWTNEGAPGLCARSIGDGVIKVQLIIGLASMGIIVWLYYKVLTKKA
jgi:hypothetical protein